NEPARLSEEQEEDSVEDRQRLLEDDLVSVVAPPLPKRGEEQRERLQHTLAQGPADEHAGACRQVDRLFEERRVRRERRGAAQRPEHIACDPIVSKLREIELEAVARPRALR